MPKKEEVEAFKDDLVEVRYPDNKIAEVRPAAADILCRKAGCVLESDYQAKIAAAKAAAKAAAEAAKDVA